MAAVGISLSILTIKFCDGDSSEPGRKGLTALSVDILMKSSGFDGNNTSTCWQPNMSPSTAQGGGGGAWGETAFHPTHEYRPLIYAPIGEVQCGWCGGSCPCFKN
jgi:hypothetical protein